MNDKIAVAVVQFIVPFKYLVKINPHKKVCICHCLFHCNTQIHT